MPAHSVHILERPTGHEAVCEDCEWRGGTWPGEPEQAVEDGWLHVEGRQRPWNIALDGPMPDWYQRTKKPPVPAGNGGGKEIL